MSGEVGNAGSAELSVGRLLEIGSRTSLMAIDAMLGLVPSGPLRARAGSGELVTAAMEARIVARRMHRATVEFAATLRQDG